MMNANAASACSSPPGGYNIIDKSGTTVLKIFGTDGNDVIIGNSLNNEIYAKGGDDRICGGDGQDYVNASGGDDKIEYEYRSCTAPTFPLTRRHICALGCSWLRL